MPGRAFPPLGESFHAICRSDVRPLVHPLLLGRGVGEVIKTISVSPRSSIADAPRASGRNTGGGYANKMANKTIVMGMVQRDGRVIAGPIPNVQSRTLIPVIEKNIAPGATITTDELASYNVLDVSPYHHGRVNHSAKEYVRGIHHTNTIEGHWSQLKRSISGTHVHVSAKHLWKYVCEFSYRRNMRGDHRAMFDLLVIGLSLPRLAET